MQDVPALGGTDVLGQLLRLGPDLLEAHHIGVGRGQPLHEALLRGGPEPVHIHRGHSQHQGTLPAHWTLSDSGMPRS